MSKGIAGKNNWALFLLLLAGIVLGGFIGSLAAGVPFLSIKITIASIIGVLIAIIIYRLL